MTLHNKNMDSATSETSKPDSLGNVSGYADISPNPEVIHDFLTDYYMDYETGNHKYGMIGVQGEAIKVVQGWLQRVEDYAAEGWDWVDTFCELAGVDDVFALKEALTNNHGSGGDKDTLPREEEDK